MNKKLIGAINKQIGMELYSSFLYRSMAVHCHLANYKGFGAWLDAQADEETSHAMKFYNYLLERGEKPVFPKLEAPPADFKSVLAIFEQALAHEKHITESINYIYKLSLDEADYPTQIMLQWFIKEQVEEEANANEMVEYLKMAGDKPGTIMMLDHQAGKRKKG